MKLPLSLLLAAAIFYCSMSLLGRAIRLHTDPADASDFATEQVAAKGLDWPQGFFAENPGKEYQATYYAPDSSGRYATVKVKRTDAGWQLVSFEQGTAEWRKHAAASR